jgi:hypothetical protein
MLISMRPNCVELATSRFTQKRSREVSVVVARAVAVEPIMRKPFLPGGVANPVKQERLLFVEKQGGVNILRRQNHRVFSEFP